MLLYICLNSVFTKKNYRFLPEITKMLITFLFFDLNRSKYYQNMQNLILYLYIYPNITKFYHKIV